MENIAKKNNELEKIDTPKPVEKFEFTNDQVVLSDINQEVSKKQQNITNTINDINRVRNELGLEKLNETPPSIAQIQADIKNLENGEFNFEIPELKKEETPEEYISRSMNYISEEYRKNEPTSGGEVIRLLQKVYYSRHENRAMNKLFSNKENGQKIKEIMLGAEANDDKKFSEEKNNFIFNKLDNEIRGSSKESASGEDGEKVEYYNNTNQERDFFTHGRKYDAYSYSSMMFGLPKDFIDTAEGKEYLHHKVDDKTIFLFGGGDSIKDLLKSEEFKPNKVINFDPFVKAESIDKNPNGIYESQTISASDKKIREMIDSGEISRADEVWATYSVPFYLDKSEEIKELITNMTSSLNEGGNARIYPIALQSAEKDGENFETRKQALVESVKSLLDSPDYNVSVFNDTLKIHKINKK